MYQSKRNRIVSFVVAAMVIVASLPLSLLSFAETFTPENVLMTDLKKTTAVIQNIAGGNVSEHNQFNGAGAIAVLTDGDTTTVKDAYGANDWGHYSGVLFELNTAHYCGQIDIFSGFAAYPDTYDVYASDSLDNLYSTENKVAEAAVCIGADKKITVNKSVQYIAIFLTDYTYNGRIAEVQAWTAEETQPEPGFVSENLLQTHVASANGILYRYDNGSVTNNDKYNQNGAITAATDGNITAHTDVYGWDANTGVGVLYTLDDSYYCGKTVIYSGLSGYPDTYKVFAANSLDTLYTTESLVATGLTCDGSQKTIEINAKIKYIAFIFESDGGRVKELQLWSAEDQSPPEFAPENVLNTSLDMFLPVVMDIGSGAVANHNQFNTTGAAEKAVDGNKTAQVDVYGANDWGKYSGVVYALTDSVYCGNAKILSGLQDYPDYYDVYAANDMSTLYKSTNKIATSVKCTGGAVDVPVNKTVKYIAFFLTAYDGNGRVIEFELWSAKDEGGGEQPDPEDPDPENPGGENPGGQDPGNQEPGDKPEVADPNSPNFIKRHFKSYAGVLQNVKNGTFAENVRFSAGNKKAPMLAIDGDKETVFDVWGALEWETPQNVGIMYSLDAAYKVETAIIKAGSESRPLQFDVYVSNSIGNLYSNANRVAQKVTCTGTTEVTIPVGKEIQYIAFVISGYAVANNICNIYEFDLTGSDTAIKKEPITWPAAPNGANILAGAAASEIIAPGGDYNSTKEFNYRFMDQQTESDIKYLTDGDIEKHYDVWSLAENDKPGVLYDLGAYYDISHVHIWAGAYNSQLLASNGYKVYASDSLQSLFKTKNLVFSYNNPEDTTGEAGVNLSLKKVRYIAILVTSTIDGAWRLREFAAYGTRSANQTAVVEQKSIIEGIDAEYYGVATDNLADPIYMGASAYVEALTDGKRDAVEFWGGKDTEKSRFVFIYDLYENYDLTGVDIYAFADAIEEDSGIHKGIKSAKVYASRTFAELFQDKNAITFKTGYDSPTEPDENSYYSAPAKADWKMARYVAFVFTIGDSRYGACRLEELKVFGTLSATQDKEPEEEKLPTYIDIEGDKGVVVRIYANSASDDLSKLGASLKVTYKTGESDLKRVTSSLSGYTAKGIYDLKIVNAAGGVLNTDGRIIRISLPKEEQDKNSLVACVDNFGAEIIANGELGKYKTIETETLRNYALVSTGKTAASREFDNGTLLWVAVVALGILAGCGIGFSILTVTKIKHK